MAEYLVSYDLEDGDPSPYGKFIEKAEVEGLLYVYQAGSMLQRLPDTTIWGVFGSKIEVRDAFDRALQAAGVDLGYTINLEKRVITKIDDSYWRSDKKKAPDQRWTKSTRFETCRAHQLNDPFFAY